MKYLYGDSTPSPLQSNFLAFLRDALGFCVHLLQAQERITGLRADGRALDTAAEAERARISGLRALVLEAAESANTDGPESASHRAVARVKGAAEQGIATTLAEVTAKLAAEHAALAARERTERDGCLDALAEYLGAHEPHEGSSQVAVQLGDTGGYTGESSATTSYGIGWTCALEFGTGHAMAGPMKVGDAMPQMELSLPEAGGWLKKGKVRPQRVDQYSIDAFSSNGREARIALRATPRAPLGLDIVILNNAVQILRAGAKDAREAECEVSNDDATKLLALRDKLLDAVTAGAGVRRRAATATIDKKALGDVPDFNVVVERVIEFAAPITNEIQAHSLSPYELVIRRLLGNDRREEVFVTSASLLDKLTPLTADQRDVFAPLNLKRVRPRTPVPGEEHDEEPGIVRTRIRTITPVAFAAHPPPSAPAPDPTPAHAPAVLVEPEPAARAVATVTSPPINVDVEPAPSNGAPAAGDSLAGDASVAIDATSKEALASTVKRIVGAARAGRTVEAFEAYAALFEDPDFAQQRPQDQRQVLKLMVMAKSPPPQSPMVVEALRSALSRLKTLSSETADPVDAEMMQVCQGLLARAPE